MFVSNSQIKYSIWKNLIIFQNIFSIIKYKILKFQKKLKIKYRIKRIRFVFANSNKVKNCIIKCSKIVFYSNLALKIHPISSNQSRQTQILKYTKFRTLSSFSFQNPTRKLILAIIRPRARSRYFSNAILFRFSTRRGSSSVLFAISRYKNERNTTGKKET